ncbi:MAG: cobalamin-binding protein [Acidimicrobiaceae bacterium]|nr:cobalamin-binding protein [Acidimicrobiaceae bacterium]
MRIVSLLPSATEIVYLLGLGESLVGVTHECDWPPDARSKRHVSYSQLPLGATPSEIDRLVTESASGGAPTHGLDRHAIRELAPDLVLTQDLCAVCAVPAGHLRAALDVLGISAEVVSLDPSSVDDVLHDVVTVGKATGTETLAEEIAARLRERLAHVGDLTAARQRPRTFALEWGDPPFNAGHWVPEMIELAGGEALLAARGVPSTRVTWEEIANTEPEIVVFMPCGYDLDGALAQVPQLLERPEIAGARAVFAAGANGYYSRPGPRLVDGTEALAWAFHGEIGLTAASGTLARVR